MICNLVGDKVIYLTFDHIKKCLYKSSAHVALFNISNIPISMETMLSSLKQGLDQCWVDIYF
jgi:hypothetical protein